MPRPSLDDPGPSAGGFAHTGDLAGGCHISAAARDARVYSIKRGAISRSVIQLDAQAVGLVSCGRGCSCGSVRRRYTGGRVFANQRALR